MSHLTMGSHPEFDALSALADLDARRGVRSRAARHVERCESCRAVVEEIRALGDAARALDIEPAPADLWERIRLAADGDSARTAASALADRAVTIVPVRERTVALDVPASSSRAWTVRRVLGGAAIVVVLAAMVLWPSRASLDASGPSRLTFTPSRPVPGGVMTVRYRPARWFSGAPRLVLAGRYVKPARGAQVRYVGARDGLDSLASLRRTADGSYEARVHLPDDFLGVRMAVFDSAGTAHDEDGSDLWVAIGGTRDHAPSLASFVASYTPASRRAQSRQSVSVADSIQRYFPGHPAGWSLYDRFGTSKGLFDFYRYFWSAERKYASLDATLSPMRGLDAEQLWAMVSLAAKIDEPAEQAKWALRLVREHPEDPRAFGALAGVVHAIELRDPPHVADSIAPWLPVLDSLYERSHAVIPEGSYDMEIFRRQGDSAFKAGWSRRVTRERPYFTTAGLPKIPDATVEAAVRRQLAAGCARPPGKFPMPDVAAWKQWCGFDHMLLWTYLAEAHLERGHPAVAEALADSALVVIARSCGADRIALTTRAKARLARGDTSGAAHDYAEAYGRWTVQKEARERAAAVLGSRFDASRFDAVGDSSRRTFFACISARKQADSARKAMYAAP
jgi:hypothetical protein